MSKVRKNMEPRGRSRAVGLTDVLRVLPDKELESVVGRLGIHSVLSLPLVTPDGVFGAMNVYARAKEAFDERSERLGELFAAPAAIAVQNAQVLEQTKRLAASLQGALSTKALIDQALGIIRSRSGASSDEAFARLRAMSQTRNVKLAVVAESLVEEAVRRAKARHTDI